MKITLKHHAVKFVCLIGLAAMGSCQSICNKEIPRHGTGHDTASFGTFNFAHLSTTDNHFRNGISMKLDFTPDNTSNPGVTCPGPVGFIQIVRTVSLRDPTQFYYPTSQKARRATSDGWYIDRPDGYESPLYGRRDDGTFAPNVPRRGALTATVSEAASMTDSPYRREYPHLRGILWQAVTVPVCIDDLNPRCHGKLLGYYCWSWTVTQEGAVADVRHGPALESLAKQVVKAQEKWNAESVWGTVVCTPQMYTLK